MAQNSKSNSKFIVICGQTASGKSALALRIAQKIGAVIINADSQQVYADLQVLSARPTKQEMQDVPHYMYGVMQADEICNAGKWLELVRETLKSLPPEKPVMFVGGTGMYLNALFNGLSPVPEIPEAIRHKVRQMNIQEVEALLRDDSNGNLQRMKRALEVQMGTGKSLKDWQKEDKEHEYSPEDFLIFSLDMPRDTLYEKIDGRFAWMIENGAIEEVEALMKRDLDENFPVMKAHGVPEIIKYLRKEISLADAIIKAQTNVRRYAKRQNTWFNNQLPHKIDVGNFDDGIILDELQKNGMI